MEREPPLEKHLVIQPPLRQSQCMGNAVDEEMNSLSANEVWDLVELPKDRKIVGSKWVFKTKRNAHGEIERYKAQLVAQGFSQKYGAGL